VEGDPLSPFVNGRLCVRCLTLDEAVNNPDRVKYPMKRVGERGENKWTRISWDEAFDTLEKEVRKVWDEYGGFTTHASSDALLKAMESDEPFPIRMVWIETSNTLACPAMDAPRVFNAMKRVPFVVNAGPFITPISVACADMLLPVAMSAERNSCRTWWTPVRSISKACSYYEAKSDEEVMLEMGKRLNPEYWPWKDDVEMMDWYLSDCTLPDPTLFNEKPTNLSLESAKGNTPYGWCLLSRP